MTSTPLVHSLNGHEAGALQTITSASGDMIEGTGSGARLSVAATAVPINHGKDTLITLGDGSTILLKGVAHIDGTFSL